MALGEQSRSQQYALLSLGMLALVDSGALDLSLVPESLRHGAERRPTKAVPIHGTAVMDLQAGAQRPLTFKLR